MQEENITLREKWLKDLTWVLTDDSSDDSKKASYKAEHIFELLSKNIFGTSERQDFKRMSVALSDYLKAVNFSEEINQLQLIALSISFGYFYKKLEEKNIVEVKEKSNESSLNNGVHVSTSSSAT